MLKEIPVFRPTLFLLIRRRMRAKYVLVKIFTVIINRAWSSDHLTSLVCHYNEFKLIVVKQERDHVSVFSSLFLPITPPALVVAVQGCLDFNTLTFSL